MSEKKKSTRTIDPAKLSPTMQRLNPHLFQSPAAHTPATAPASRGGAQDAATGAKKKKATKPRVPSILEKRFKELWNGPELVEEYRFCPTRRWRADFAHLATKTLIEVEGGAYSNGRHNRASGFLGDAAKYLEAALLGYRVIRLTSPQLKPETVDRVAGAMRGWMQDLRK